MTALQHARHPCICKIILLMYSVYVLLKLQDDVINAQESAAVYAQNQRNRELETVKPKLAAIARTISNLEGQIRSHKKDLQSRWSTHAQKERAAAHLRRAMEALGVHQEQHKECTAVFQKLMTDYYFPDPTGHKYKLRLCIEDRVYMAARDIGIDSFQCSFKIICHDKIIVQIENISAILQVHDLRLEGKKTLMLVNQFVGSRIEVKIQGNVTMNLSFKGCPEDDDSTGMYKSAGRMGQQQQQQQPPEQHDTGEEEDESGWKVDEDSSMFDLSLTKLGAAVPDSLINWIIQKFLPDIIMKSTVSAVPRELGPFLKRLTNRVLLFGNINITGQVLGKVRMNA